MKIFSLTLLALCGFAANSILCRMALAPGLIDATTFTTVRICAGALTLALLARRWKLAGDWYSAVTLFSYAILFSCAYLRIGAAVGALVLFGSVQVTMIGWGLRTGERVRVPEWCGLALAVGGLVALALRGLTEWDPLGLGLMAVAGIAWGVYSLRGRGVSQPLLATAGNFVRCVPMATIASLIAYGCGSTHATAEGVMFAVASGALASGIGYSIWYAALPHLTVTRAAFAQLCVPVMAAAAAVVVLDEPLTRRLLFSGVAIVFGVALTFLPRKK